MLLYLHWEVEVVGSEVVRVVVSLYSSGKNPKEKFLAEEWALANTKHGHCQVLIIN